MGDYTKQNSNPTNSDIEVVDATKGENIHNRALSPDLSWDDRPSDTENGMTHHVSYKPRPVYGGTGFEQLLFNAEYNNEHGFNSATKKSGVVGLNDSSYDADIRRESELEDLNEFRANSQAWWEQIGGGIGRFATITAAGTIQNIVGTAAGIIGGLNEGFKGNQEQIVDDNGVVWDVDADGHKVIKDENGKMWLCDDNGNILTDENGNPIESKATFSGFWGRFWNGFINNEVNTLMNDVIESANEAMPVYRTKAEQEAGLLESVWSSGFWADQIANLGWTSAAIVSTVLTGGMGMASAAGNITKAMLKSPRAAQFVYRLVGGITGSMAEASTEAIGAYNKAKGQYNKMSIDAYKDSMRTIDEVINEETIDELRRLGINPATADRTVIESIRDKVAQSHIDQMNENIQKYKFNMEGFEKSSRDAALNTFGANVLILSLTNTMGTFSNISTPFSNANRIAKGSIANPFLESGKKIAAAKGELYARKAIEVLSQGNEEMLQAVATDAAVNYAGQRFDPNNIGVMRGYFDIAGEAFVGNLSSIDSWKEFTGGLLTGLLGAPGMGHKHTQKENEAGEMGSSTGVRPNWNGGIWGIKSEVEEEYKTSTDIYNEYNESYNNLYQSPNLRAKTAMLIGTIGDNDAMGKAARENDKKEYLDKEGEKTMRMVESFANVGRLGELSALVGEKIEMTDEQLEAFAAMNSEEIKDADGNGTGRFKSALPLVDSNGELVTNTKEGRDKLREKLERDQAKTQKLIKDYARVLEEVDETTGFQLNREQLAMLTWMRMKSTMGEERQDDMTKDKISIMKRFYDAYRRTRTYTDKNDDDYWKNLDKEAEYLQQLLEKYKDIKDEELSNEDKENKNIFTSELRRVRRAKEILSEEKGKLQREKQKREPRERDTSESNNNVNVTEGTNRVEVSDEKTTSPKTMTELLFETLIETMEKDPEHSGSIMAAMLGHKIGTREKTDANGSKTSESVYFADIIKDILEKDGSLDQSEYESFVDYLNDMMRLEQDKFAFDSMFRKLIGAPEHVRDYMDKMLNKIENKRQKAINKKALENYSDANNNINFEYITPDDILANIDASEEEKQEARNFIIQNNEKARVAESTRQFNKMLSDVVKKEKEEATSPEEVMILNQLVNFLEWRKYKDRYDFVYQTQADFRKYLEEAYDRGIINSIDNVVDMTEALAQMQDAIRKDLLQQIEIQKLIDQAQKKGNPLSSDNTVQIQSVENPQVREVAKGIIKNIISQRSTNSEAKKLYDNAVKTLVDYAKNKNIKNDVKDNPLPEKIETEEDINKLIDAVNAYARGTYGTDGEAYWFEEKEYKKLGKDERLKQKQEDKENYVKNVASKALETFNIVNAISVLTYGQANLGKSKNQIEEYKGNFDYTLYHIQDSVLSLSDSKFGDITFLDLISVPEGESIDDFFKKVKDSGINITLVEYEPTDLINVPFVLMQSVGNASVSTKTGFGAGPVDIANQSMFVAVPKRAKSSVENSNAQTETGSPNNANPTSQQQKPVQVQQSNQTQQLNQTPQNQVDLSNQKHTVELLNNLKNQFDKYVFFDKTHHTYYLYTGENLDEAREKFNKGEITKENAPDNGFKVHDISVSSLRYGKEDIRNSPELEESQQYGNDIDLIVREYHKGTPVDEIKKKLIKDGRKSKFYGVDEEYPDNTALNFDYVEDFIKEVKKAEDDIRKKYPDCKIITDEMSLVAWIKKLEGVDLKETQLLLAGQPDMLVIDKDGKIHIFDMKAKKIQGETPKDILISETNKNEYNDKNDYERYTTQLLGYARILESYGLDVDTKNVNLIQFSTVKKKQDDNPYYVGISTIDASKCKPAVIHTNDITSITFGNKKQNTTQTEPQPIVSGAAAVVSVENDNNDKAANAIKQDVDDEIKNVKEKLNGKDNVDEKSTPTIIAISGGDNSIPQKPTVEEFDNKQVGYIINDVLEYRKEEEEKGVYKPNSSSKLQQYLKNNGAYEYLNSGKLHAGAKVFLRILEDDVNSPDGSTKALGVYVLDGKMDDGSPKFQIIGVIFDDSRTRSGYKADDNGNGGKIDTSHNIRCNIGNAVTGRGNTYTRRNTNVEGNQILSNVAYLTDAEGNRRQVNVGTNTITRIGGSHKKYVGKDQSGVEREFLPVENTDGKRLVVSAILLGRIQQNADIDNAKDHKPIREVTCLEGSFDEAFKQGKLFVGIIQQNRAALLIDDKGHIINDVDVSIPQAFPTGSAIVAFKDGRNNWRCSLVIGRDFNRNDINTDNPICAKIKHLMSHKTSDNNVNGILHKIDLLKNSKDNPLTTDNTINNIINNLQDELGYLFNYMNRKPKVTIDKNSYIAEFQFTLSNGQQYSYFVNLATSTDVEGDIYNMMEKSGLRYSVSQQIFFSDASQKEKEEAINGLVDLLKTNISDFSTRNTRFALSYEDDFIVGEKDWIETPQKTVVEFENNYIVKLNDYDGTEGRITLRDSKGSIISNEDIAKEFGYMYNTPEEAANLSNTISALLNEIMKNIQSGNKDGKIKVSSVNDRSSVVYFDMKTKKCISYAEFNTIKEEKEISSIIATPIEQEQIAQPQENTQEQNVVAAQATQNTQETQGESRNNDNIVEQKQETNKTVKVNSFRKRIKRRELLSAQKNRRKNQLFVNGIGKYNAKQILANINNSASLLMEQFVSNSMNITVLSDIEFDNKYGVNTDGVYDNENGIVVRESCQTSTIIHEVCHALVPVILQDNESAKQLREVFAKFKKYLDIHKDLSHNTSDGVEVAYSTRSLYEFLAELFSNERVVEILKSIPDDYFTTNYLGEYEVNEKYSNKLDVDEISSIQSNSNKKSFLRRVIDIIVNFFTKRSNRFNEQSRSLYDIADSAARELIETFSRYENRVTDENKIDVNDINGKIAKISSSVSGIFNGVQTITVSNVSNAIKGQLDEKGLTISNDNKNEMSSIIVNTANVVTSIADSIPGIANARLFTRTPGNIYIGSGQIPYSIDGNVNNNINIKNILEQALRRQIELMLQDEMFSDAISKTKSNINEILRDIELNSIDKYSMDGMTASELVMLGITNPTMIGSLSQIKIGETNAFDIIKNAIVEYANRYGNSDSISTVLSKLTREYKGNVNKQLKLKLDDFNRNKKNIANYSNRIKRILDNTIYSNRAGFVGAKQAILKLNEAGILNDVITMARDTSIMDGLESQRRLFRLVIPTIEGKNFTESEIDNYIEDYNDFIYGYTSSFVQEKVKCLFDMLKDLSLSAVISDGINTKNNVTNFVIIDKSSIFANQIEEIEEKCKI